mgnify:CR=1 FL=1
MWTSSGTGRLHEGRDGDKDGSGRADGGAFGAAGAGLRLDPWNGPAEGKGEPSTSPWPRGTTLAILYDPAAPARVMPAAELERVGWLPVMLLGGGAALLMLGLFAFRLRARLGPRADSRPTRGADALGLGAPTAETPRWAG